eukprot:TRINITY_DN2061_c0_g2_i2.p1 TRINITY_DN2061_c0_g2~~TRINITY_DN2061_c0_g2_i2.p1  ORF type:complete len:422 (-),score=68.61 TRINITY_DN2061_c0_g2_i2:196-1407(-)
MFTIYLTKTEKKSVLISDDVELGTVLQKICLARAINLDEYIALDNNGNTVNFSKSIDQIEGRCIRLVTEETKCRHSVPMVPYLPLPSPPTEQEKFLFPLPSDPLSSISHDLSESLIDPRRKSGTYSKSFSSSLIPKAWSLSVEKSQINHHGSSTARERHSSSIPTPIDGSVKNLIDSDRDSRRPSHGDTDREARRPSQSHGDLPWSISSRENNNTEIISCNRTFRGSSMRGTREFKKLTPRNSASDLSQVMLNETEGNYNGPPAPCYVPTPPIPADSHKDKDKKTKNKKSKQQTPPNENTMTLTRIPRSSTGSSNIFNNTTTTTSNNNNNNNNNTNSLSNSNNNTNNNTITTIQSLPKNKQEILRLKESKRKSTKTMIPLANKENNTNYNTLSLSGASTPRFS